MKKEAVLIDMVMAGSSPVRTVLTRWTVDAGTDSPTKTFASCSLPLEVHLMSLAVRLLLALGIVALFVTAIVGFAARDVSRREVEHSFEQRINAAMLGARQDLVWEATTLSELLTPQCKHDSFVDHALLDLERAGGQIDKLPPGRSIALRRIVPEQQKALRLDELLLVTGDGLVLGASDVAKIGTRDRALAARLERDGGKPQVVRQRGRAEIQVHCTRSSGGVTLGLIGSRDIGPILQRVGGAYGVALALDRESLISGPDALERKLAIGEIAGLEVFASVSRQPLFEALALVDSSIFIAGGIAVLLSVALAMFFARGLSQPLVELAQQTREVVRGSPRPVRARGGRELSQLAHSFNRTIDELSAMRRRLARTERIAARREVARQVAHEIKNPLAPIRAAMETLRRLHARQSPEFEGYFDEATRTVLDEVHRIKNIVGEFTKFARMPPPKFERIDLEELASGVVALHHAAGDASGPQVTLEVEDVPPIMADHDQLVQVLTNLVQNGIEATVGALAETARTPHVVVSVTRASEREARIEVRDNGPGIDPKVRDRLFEPYVSTKPEGTGLGLAIVVTIVHEHGGEISCSDADGGGASFEVVLPIDGPPLLEKAPNSSAGTTTA
jgi:signal transduction histidine kinase